MIAMSTDDCRRDRHLGIISGVSVFRIARVFTRIVVEKSFVTTISKAQPYGCSSREDTKWNVEVWGQRRLVCAVEWKFGSLKGIMFYVALMDYYDITSTKSEHGAQSITTTKAKDLCLSLMEIPPLIQNRSCSSR